MGSRRTQSAGQSPPGIHRHVVWNRGHRSAVRSIYDVDLDALRANETLRSGTVAARGLCSCLTHDATLVRETGFIEPLSVPRQEGRTWCAPPGARDAFGWVWMSRRRGRTWAGGGRTGG